MHARQPFVKPRRVLASLWGPRAGLLTARAGAALPEGATGLAFPLNSGDTIPAVGFGCWKIAKEATADAVVAAIRAGYRHLDCASDYGNEKEVGAGIASAIEQGACCIAAVVRCCRPRPHLLPLTPAPGLVTRKDLFVTSKLWNTYHAKEHVPLALDRTLKDLGLAYVKKTLLLLLPLLLLLLLLLPPNSLASPLRYVDLYLIHFPIPLQFVPFETRYPPEWFFDPTAARPRMHHARVPTSETWGAMEALCDAGLARSIGVSNHNAQHLRDILSYARIAPALLQVELHPHNQQPKLLRFCKANGIAVTGFSPLGSGSYVEIGGATPADSALAEPAVAEIAAAHGCTPAQVLLRWNLQRGVSVVPKSSKPHRMAENISLKAVALTDAEMAAMAALDKGRRFNDPGVFCEGAFGAFTPIFE